MQRSRELIAALATGLVAAGCKGRQSMLDPAGIQAEEIFHLWWLYFGVSVVVYTIVVLLIATAIALFARRRSTENNPPSPPKLEWGKTLVVGGAVALTAAT